MEEVKNHFKKYGVMYVGALGIMGIITTYLIMSKHNNSGINMQGVFYKVNIEQNTYSIKAKGNSGNHIIEPSTGRWWRSQNECAKDLGSHPSTVSGHLKGKIPNVKGHILEKTLDGQTEYRITT